MVWKSKTANSSTDTKRKNELQLTKLICTWTGKVKDTEFANS